MVAETKIREAQLAAQQASIVQENNELKAGMHALRRIQDTKHENLESANEQLSVQRQRFEEGLRHAQKEHDKEIKHLTEKLQSTEADYKRKAALGMEMLKTTTRDLYVERMRNVEMKDGPPTARPRGDPYKSPRREGTPIRSSPTSTSMSWTPSIRTSASQARHGLSSEARSEETRSVPEVGADGVSPHSASESATAERARAAARLAVRREVRRRAGVARFGDRGWLETDENGDDYWTVGSACIDCH